MKKLLLLFFLTLAGRGLFAQDLILTQEGDSINCKINKVAKDRVHFTFVHDGEVRKTLLMRSQIKLFQHNYYSTSAIPEGAGLLDPEVFPKIRLGLTGGYSYRTAPVPDGVNGPLEEYITGLKSGYHLNADAAYYFSEQFGLGFRYSYSNAKNEIDGVTITRPDGSQATGKMSDDITVSFVGPYFSSRLLNENKLNAFVFSLGLGYMGYTSDSRLVDPYSVRASTVGFVVDVGYDMTISKNLALGFQLAMVTGTLSELEITRGGVRNTVTLAQDEQENLSRIDLSVGLRFVR
ncbi:MAG: hypothetical protein ACO1OQ_07940 [Rufibacter sp.]